MDGVEARQRRPKWHLIYYLLAAIDLLTICGSLYLNHSVMGIYRDSVEVNQDWTSQLTGFLDLAGLAQATNAPGNDVFDSHDVDAEKARRDAALAKFEAKIVDIRRSLSGKPETVELAQLTASIYEISEAMDSMLATADLIFVHFRNNDADQAGRYMATMDRTYGVLMQRIADAQRQVQGIQFGNFQRELTSATELGRFEYVIGSVIFVIISLVMIYGHKIAVAMRTAENERQRLIAALQVSEAKAQGRLHDAIESINGGFVLYDADDRLVMCNETYRGMYPATADLNVPGTKFEDLIRADVARGQVPEAVGGEKEWLAQRMDAHLNGRSTTEQQLADGRWILVSEQRTSEGGVVGIRADITDRKHAELRLKTALEELKTATEKLARQERLSTLGQVAGTVSHELRNPLAAVSNSLAMIRQVTAGKQLGIDRSLDRADRNIDRCVGIIGDILDFTRVRELDRKPVAIDQWLSDALAEINLPPSVAIQRELQFGSEVSLDRDRFRQIIVNLVENAAQALTDPAWTPTEGNTRDIVLRTESAGPYMRLSVSDNGPGIPEDVRTKIFEPLFTTKSFGVGLGLPTVRQIVEQHGGTIDVESKVGDGTTFSIWLPRQATPDAGATTNPESHQQVA